MHAVLLGGHLFKPAEALAQTGIDVMAIEKPGLNYSDPDICRKLLEPIILDVRPDIIMTGHTSSGAAFLPLIAFKTGASCITGVKKITEESDELIYTRLIRNGKFESAIRSEKEITAITVLPGAFPSASPVSAAGKIICMNAGEISGRITLENISRPEVSDFSFDDADVIVAAGRGIGEPEKLDKIKEFSNIFRRAAVAGSRPLIDMGWMPYKFQVGITGKTVTPRIYIACGISGSSQHIAGMAGSEFIIAINSDPRAAIFNVSDICIVEDLFSFIDAVVSC